MTERDMKCFRAKRREVMHAKSMLQNNLSDMGYPHLDYGKIGRTPNGSVVEVWTEQTLQLQRKYVDLLEAYDAEATAVEAELARLTPDERSVIRAYYIQGLTWEGVCDTLHISWSQSQRLKRSAIRKIEANKPENKS